MNSLYLKARDACIDNVRQYIRDARKLMETGSYGHACALLILGQEELGKAFAYHDTDSSFYTRASEQYINLHTKTGQAHITKLMQYSFLSALRKAWEYRNSGIDISKSAFSEYSEGFKAINEGDSKRLEKEDMRMRNKQKEINKLKMDALYVDIARGSVLSPLDPKFMGKASRVLTELEKTLDFVVNVIFKFPTEH